MDYFAELPEELINLICDLLDNESLVVMCCVNLAWRRSVSGLNNLWKQRCLALGLRSPDGEWQSVLTRAVKIQKKMRNGSAFRSRQLCLPDCSTESEITSVVYKHDLLVAVVPVKEIREPRIMIWKDLHKSPVEDFSLEPEVYADAISLDDGILAIGTYHGGIILERLDTATGRRLPRRLEAKRVRYSVESISLFAPLHLVVLLSEHEDERHVDMSFRCARTGAVLGRPFNFGWMSDAWSAPTLLPGHVRHRLVCISCTNARIISWPCESPDGAPQGDLLNLHVGPDLVSDTHATNFQSDGSLIAYYSHSIDCDQPSHITVFDVDSDYVHSLPLPMEWTNNQVLALNGDFVISSYKDINGQFMLCALSHRSHQRLDYYLPHEVRYDEILVLGEFPWPSDVTNWEEGRLVAGYLGDDNELHVVTTAGVD